MAWLEIRASVSRIALAGRLLLVSRWDVEPSSNTAFAFVLAEQRVLAHFREDDRPCPSCDYGAIPGSGYEN